MLGHRAIGGTLVARLVVAVLLSCVLAGWPGFAATQTATPVWARSFGGTSSNNFAATAGDADGNVYLAGYYSSPTLTLGTGVTVSLVGTGSDMVVAKFDAAGSVIWAKSFGGATASSALQGLAVDASGNVFFTGYYQAGSVGIGGTTLAAPTGTYNMVVAKLNAADGSTAWAYAFAGGATSEAQGSGVALDSSGNPIFIGSFKGTDIDVRSNTIPLRAGVQNQLVAKLDTNGTYAWAKSYGGASFLQTGTTINPRGVAVDGSGKIYISGYFSGGNPNFGGTDLTPAGTSSNIYLAKFDAAMSSADWVNNYGALNVTAEVGRSSLVVDGSGNSYLSGYFHGGDLPIGGTTLTWKGASGSNSDTFVAKIDTNGTAAAWARTWGASGSANRAFALARDTGGNVYVAAYMRASTLAVGEFNLTRTGTQDALVARLDGSTGTPVWAANYGGASPATAFGVGIAVTGSGMSRIVLAGNFSSGAISVGSTLLAVGSFNTIFVASIAQTHGLTVTTNGAGTVTSTPSGISCGAICTAQFEVGTAVTLTASGGALSAWSGACSGASAATSATMSEARSCIATFAGAGGGLPPIPPPPFVSPSTPPPAAISAETTGSGQGTLSIASSFANPGSLNFTVNQTSGAALPAWLTFNPSTVSFNYTVPLPADLPVQPSADPAGRAGRSIVNTVYPLAVLVQRVPVSLTATSNGQNYTATINMDFYAPRSPVAISAVSYAAGGASGNAASARPVLSWDGGQVVFETLATNISQASSSYSSIVRYHGLSGKRDLLSQTAIPGGGVANGADGNSNNPAVAAAGNYAAFASVAAGVSSTPNNRLRQVYRTSLVYPRVTLNEAATPAAVMVSATAAGIAADAAADLPSISERGDFIAFESAAGNLGRNPDRLSQIWRKQPETGAIVLVSSAADGTSGNGDSRNVSLSWDGQYAVFDSTATNLAAGFAGGRHVYLKNLQNGLVYRLSTAAGAGNPKLDARLTSVVYVSAAGTTSQVLRYDIATATTTVVSVTPSGLAGNGDSTQAGISADGRFVTFRSVATDLVAGHVDNGMSQIWVRDVMRGVSALVSQTASGAPGNGAAADPAISGDGSQVAFTSLARDLVNGAPLPGQIHLAANPLVLPGRTAYWYTTDGGNLTWSVERWGARALISGLAYGPNGGTAVWAAGECRFTGLTCQGTVSQWAQAGAASTIIGPVTLAFGADGRAATVALGDGVLHSLALYPVGGTRTTGFAGLPQNGYWGVVGNPAGVSSLFIDTDTQAGTNGASVQSMHVTLFGYDAVGTAQWYAAEGNLGADQTFTGQLYLYAGGSSWMQGSGTNAPSATTVGTIRLNFAAADRASVQLPDGRTVTIARWRF